MTIARCPDCPSPYQNGGCSGGHDDCLASGPVDDTRSYANDLRNLADGCRIKDFCDPPELPGHDETMANLDALTIRSGK